MKHEEEEKERRRRRSSICDVTLYLKGPCTALCTNTLSQTVSLYYFLAIRMYVVPIMFGYIMVDLAAQVVGRN